MALSSALHIQNREKDLSKKWCLKALILTRSTIHVEHFNVFSWFCALSREGIASVQINFFYINKQLTWLMNFCFLWVILEKSVCPTHTLKASLIFLVYGQIFPNFASRGQIKKTSNFDPIFGIKTNRICSSVIPPPPPPYWTALTHTYHVLINDVMSGRFNQNASTPSLLVLP